MIAGFPLVVCSRLRVSESDISAKGQKQTSGILRAMSVVRLIADILLFYEKDKLFTGE